MAAAILLRDDFDGPALRELGKMGASVLISAGWYNTMDEQEADPPLAEPELRSDAMQSILTINGGSSSIKFALYQIGDALERSLYGKVEGVG